MCATLGHYCKMFTLKTLYTLPPYPHITPPLPSLPQCGKGVNRPWVTIDHDLKAFRLKLTIMNI